MVSMLVVGLSSNGNTLALRQLLSDAGLPLGPLKTIDPSDLPSRLTQGAAGSELFRTDVGMRIPGIGGSHLGADFSGDDSIASRLTELEIPDGAVENYAEALERGRFVIAYRATSAEAALGVEKAFTAAGIANVRRY